MFIIKSMAAKKRINQLKKNIKKGAKNNPNLFAIIVSIILIIAIAIGVYVFIQNKNSKEEPGHEEDNPAIISEDEISINFIDLESRQTGDAIYIKAGTTDILIDSGSSASSANTICDFLNKPGRVEDGKLEYVIATHAHEDHISGFVGSGSVIGILDSYQIDTIIMYSGRKTTSTLANKFDSMLANKSQNEGTKILKAHEAVGQAYTIADNTTMQVLDHEFYYNTSSNENNNSVVTLFTQGESHYLFTGDLEAGGEKSLVENNPNLPKCRLYKAAHHGSNSANSKRLLDVIEPEIVCVTCCAGSFEYTKTWSNTFPAQEVVNRILTYTDKIYVTTYSTEDQKDYKSLNGTITFVSDGVNYEIHGSENDTKLTDTVWYKKRLENIEKQEKEEV